MSTRSLVTIAAMSLLLAACGDDGGGSATSAEGPVDGFTRSEDTDLVELAVQIDDADAASAVHDELAEVEGWLGSLNTSGATTVRFVPYPEAIDAAIANQARVEATLAAHGPVDALPYSVVTATFTAAGGSPLAEDPRMSSDPFDDLAGCDWDGSALHEDHFWYCEPGIAGSSVAHVRSVFARQAGIEPGDIVLVEYR